MENMTEMVRNDQFAKLAGVRVVDIGKGTAVVEMTIGPEHLNGIGIVHGGAIFILADVAFAASCNSHGVTAVAVHASISFLKAAKSGTLRAVASEDSATGRMGSYSIKVTDEAGDVVAMFQGLAYRKGQ